jgi:hypothetical protein
MNLFREVHFPFHVDFLYDSAYGTITYLCDAHYIGIMYGELRRGYGVASSGTSTGRGQGGGREGGCKRAQAVTAAH